MMSTEESALLLGGMKDGDDDEHESAAIVRQLSPQFVQELRKARSFYFKGSDSSISDESVYQAAFYVRDAILDEVENPIEGSYDPYPSSTDGTRNIGLAESSTFHIKNRSAIACRRICTNQYVVKLFQLSIWALVFLTFVEPPCWCRDLATIKNNNSIKINNSNNDIRDDACFVLMNMEGPPASIEEVTSQETVELVDYYPNAGVFWVSVQQSEWIELVCVIIVSVIVMLRIGRDGFSLPTYLRKGTTRAIRITQLICIIVLFVGVIYSQSRYIQMTRIVLFCTVQRSIHNDIRSFFRMIPRILNVLGFFFFILLFYAWMGTVCFYRTQQGVEGFENLYESMWTLWICVTTANYPDVMMISYSDNRLVATYFVSFMIISYFFAMNLITSIVATSYSADKEHFMREQSEKSHQYLSKSFHIMAKGRVNTKLSKRIIISLFDILNNDFPEIRTINDEEKELIFAVLDKDGSGLITKQEFLAFGTIMMLEFYKESERTITFVENIFPALYQSEKYRHLCSVIKSETFEWIVDAVLFLNAVVISIQTYPQLIGQDIELDPATWDGSIDTIWEAIEAIFMALYVIECILKITCLGFKQYFRDIRHRFDFAIMLLAIMATIYVYYPNDFNDSAIIRFIVMARMLRLLRLLSMIKPFRLVSSLLVRTLPAISKLLLLLFLLMSFYATLGVYLFGGMISRDPDNPLSYLLLKNGSDFTDANYYANNFNDVVSAMNVMFNLLVINNWTELEIGFEAVTQSKWVRFYFLSFHILGVLYGLNIFISIFMSSMENNIFLNGNESSKPYNQSRSLQIDASEISGTTTTLKGKYTVKFRDAQNLEDGMDDVNKEDKLKKMLT